MLQIQQGGRGGGVCSACGCTCAAFLGNPSRNQPWFLQPGDASLSKSVRAMLLLLHARARVRGVCPALCLYDVCHHGVSQPGVGSQRRTHARAKFILARRRFFDEGGHEDVLHFVPATESGGAGAGRGEGGRTLGP